jgi:hypothetical protein
MLQAKITISAELAGRAYWKAYKSSLLTKQVLESSVIILFTTLVLQVIEFKKRQFFDSVVPVLFLVWIFSVLIRYLRLRQATLNIGAGYSFNAVLDDEGVEVSGEKTNWDAYVGYIEYDDYLEIHGPDRAISFLPKTEDLKEVVTLTMLKISPLIRRHRF